MWLGRQLDADRIAEPYLATGQDMLMIPALRMRCAAQVKARTDRQLEQVYTAGGVGASS